MRRACILGVIGIVLAASLAAQATVGGGTPRAAGPRPTPTPGIGRSPGASALPATPGANSRPTVEQRLGNSNRRYRGGRYRNVGTGYGYGYGGVYIDQGSGPVAIPEEDQTESSASHVVTVPAREKKAPPNPRVYNVREDIDGNVEMTPIASDRSPHTVDETGSAAVYWLIALRNGTIQAASRYSMDSETVTFTSRRGTEFVVSLTEVDLPFTKRLNRDLGRQFGDH